MGSSGCMGRTKHPLDLKGQPAWRHVFQTGLEARSQMKSNEAIMAPKLLRPTLLTLALLALSACSGLGASIQGGYGIFQMDGDIALGPSVGNVALDTIKTDIQKGLGLDEEVGTPYARADLELAVARISASGFTHNQEGEGRLTVDFGDITLGTDVNTEITMNAAKASVIFDMINIGVLRIGPGLGASYFDIDMNVRSLVRNEDVEIQAPVPMIFLQAEVGIGGFSALVEAGGIYYEAPEAEGIFFDIEAMARLNLHENIHLFGGARWLQIDGKGDVDGHDFEIDLGLRGLMVGIGFDV